MDTIQAAGDQTGIPIMAHDKAETNGDKDKQSCFTSHTAQLEAGQSQFTLRVLKMDGSTMLFLTSRDSDIFDELAVAMPARAPSTEIIASTIIGGHGQTESLVLATKLSKRYGRHFLVSMNIALDRIAGPLFEKTLVDYMQDHLDKFV